MIEQKENLLVALENGIRRVTFNRPERRNTVNAEMMPQMLSKAILGLRKKREIVSSLNQVL
jgi:enoyl-CoA hydratase/carnithine racemase